MKLNSFSGQAIATFIDRMIKMGGVFVINAYIARTLGSTEFGMYSYFLSLFTLFLAVTSGGTDIICGREFSENKYSPNFFIRILAIRVTIYIASVAFFVSVHDLYFKELAINLMPVFISYLFFCTLNIFEPYLIAKNKGHMLLISSSIIGIPFILTKLYILFVSKNLEYKLWTDVLEMVLLILFYANYIRRIEGKSKKLMEVDNKNCKYILSHATPLWFNAILIIVYTKIDQILLGNLLSIQKLGEYSVAVQVSMIITIPTSVLMTAALPRLIEKKLLNIRSYHQFLSKLTKYIIIVFGVWYLFIATFGVEFLMLIFGKSYSAVHKYILVYSIGVFFNCLGMVAGQWAVAERQYWLSFYRSIVGVVLSVALNLVLIPRFGIMGSCLTAAFCFFITNFLIYGLFKDGKEIFKIQLLALINILLFWRVINHGKRADSKH